MHARITPTLSVPQIKQLVTSLDAWHQLEKETVTYSRFLDGRREPTSVHGMFPKQRPRGPSKNELERKAKAEEEEKKKKKLEDEEKKAKEVNRTKRIERREGSPKRLPAGGAEKRPSKEDQKRQQMEQQREAEAARRKAEEARRQEEAEIKAEIKGLRDTIAKLSSKAKMKSDVP